MVRMLKVPEMLIPDSNRVRCHSNLTRPGLIPFTIQIHGVQNPSKWTKIPIGLVALADLTTIATHTALNGSSNFLDILVLGPGMHKQQYATELNRGELPPTAALTSGYVFRVENQATVFYLQKMGIAGHLVTMSVEEIPKPNGRSFLKAINKVLTVSFLLNITPACLTLIASAYVILIEDWWTIAVLLTFILARTLNVVVIRRRSVPGWKGVKEPGFQGDLLVLLSQDRWVRLKGPVDALKAVTSGQWMRDMTFWESSLTAMATLMIYITAAVSVNASKAGQIIILALLLLSVGLVAVRNERQKSLHMYGCEVQVEGRPKKYARRLDLANELIEYTGRDDWAIRLGMVNQKAGDANETVKVVL